MPEDQSPAPPPIQPPLIAPGPSSPSSPDKDARLWNMLCHLSALAGYIGIPFGNILGPLIVWQVKKDAIPSVNVHGKAALNFQITVSLALLVSGLAMVLGILFCIGWLLAPVVALIGIAGLVFPIIGGIKANNGEDYQYPWSLELVK